MDCKDYKELISNMRKYSAFGLPPEECKRVATAIETLLAEREAAGFKHGEWLQVTKWWQGGSMWKNVRCVER